LIGLTTSLQVETINAKNLRDVHQRLEKGRTIGKIVLAEWN
ncbi:MAG: zinc-binding alcohol dehydrogenase family protein, partial [Cyanobacteria bacterium J06628_3]